MKCMLLFLLTLHVTIAQNLAPNGSFEDFTICPNNQGDFDMDHWYKVLSHLGTADYLNTCSTNPVFSVPENILGNQDPDDGNAYVGIFSYNSNNELREYFQVQLIEPLIIGHIYDVSFKVSLADYATAANSHLGVAFTSSSIEGDFTLNHLDVVSQVFANTVISDKENWVTISGTFQALGDEQFLTIGNFFADDEIFIEPLVPAPIVFSYYYVDSVSVVDTTLGINDFAESKVKVFPNPFETNITISLTDGSISKQIKVYTLTGLVKSIQNNVNKVNLSELQSGIYFLEVTLSDDSSEVFKIIKI